MSRLHHLIILLAVALSSLALGAEPADGPAAAPPEAAGVPDTAEVLVVVEAPPAGVQSIATTMEQALTGLRLTGRALGGLQAVKGTNLKNARADATAAGAGSILHVKVTNRVLTNASQFDYRLEATVTIYQAQGKDWKQVYTGAHKTSGSQRDVAGLRVSDCDKLTDICAELLISRLFPYKLTNFVGRGGKPSIDLTIKNTSQAPLRTVKLHGPEGARGLFGPSVPRLDLEPGEEKTVTVTLGTSGGSVDWRKAYVSYLEFSKADSSGAGGHGGKRHGGANR